jgi:hypothetical protein
VPPAEQGRGIDPLAHDLQASLALFFVSAREIVGRIDLHVDEFGAGVFHAAPHFNQIWLLERFEMITPELEFANAKPLAVVSRHAQQRQRVADLCDAFGLGLFEAIAEDHRAHAHAIASGARGAGRTQPDRNHQSASVNQEGSSIHV